MAPLREGTVLPTDRKCSTRSSPRGFSHARRRIVGEKSRLHAIDKRVLNGVTSSIQDSVNPTDAATAVSPPDLSLVHPAA